MNRYLKLFVLAIAVVFASCSENEDLINERAAEANKDFKGCETAFAYCAKNSICFADTEPTSFNRWGWVTGPIQDGYKDKCEIYAGAAKCDTSRGTMVGWLDYDFSDGELVVYYTATDGYEFTEIHLYVGTEMYPQLPNGKPTVAPGHYNYGGDYPDGIDQVQFNIEDYEEGDELYIIAHAVVCPAKK